jgi:hypothetical protein
MSEHHEIRTRLTTLPGVRDVCVSSFPERVSVVVDPTTTQDLVSEAIRSLLRAEALGDPSVEVTVGARPDRRSRFDSLDTFQPAPGRLGARVVLEWDGKLVHGEAEGERNQLAEVRICASAALRAVEAIAGGKATFNLIGVKELIVFDHNMVVVLILSPEVPDQRLIGTAFVSDNRCTAAALATLNATNRILSRFLTD